MTEIFGDHFAQGVAIQKNDRAARGAQPTPKLAANRSFTRARQSGNPEHLARAGLGVGGIRRAGMPRNYVCVSKRSHLPLSLRWLVPLSLWWLDVLSKCHAPVMCGSRWLDIFLEVSQKMSRTCHVRLFTDGGNRRILSVIKRDFPPRSGSARANCRQGFL